MKSKLFSSLSLLVGLSLVLGSCMNDESDSITAYEQLVEDIMEIDAYLEANPPADPSDIIVKDGSGIRLVITERPASDIDGTEPVPMGAAQKNVMEVSYVGRLFSNGTQFEEDDSYAFTLSTSDNGGSGAIEIEGCNYALSMMTEGMKATAYIPSYYAYGTSGSGSIGANEILVFDLHVKAIDRSDEEPLFSEDKAEIAEHLENVNNVVVHPNGFSYILESIGTGPRPDSYDQVTIRYTGKVLDNGVETVFAQDLDQGPESGFSSMPVNYILGLAVGFQLMQEGDQATFYLPSALAYGSSSSENFAANSILVFKIELLKVTPHEQ